MTKPVILTPMHRGKRLQPKQLETEAPPRSIGAGDGAVAAPIKPGSSANRRDVSELPEELQKLVEKMLVEGASIEDTVEALNERPDGGITFQAMQNFYRSRVDLQEQRVERQLENVRALKAAMGDPESAMRELADALFLTGVTGMRRESKLELLRASQVRLENENLHFRQRLDRIKVKEEAQKLAYIRAKTRAENARVRLLEKETKKAGQLLHRAEKSGKLDPQAYQQIREIYGLLAEGQDSGLAISG